MQILSPAGDMESAKSAIQNGADAIYFGAKNFSARAFAKNFDDNELKEIIEYARLRNIKTYLTINTLLSNIEITKALELVKQAYTYGVTGIIVQDIGFTSLLLKTFPKLEIIASTQMSICNLEGAKFVQDLGFKRVVLARELSIEDITYIKEKTNIEIEVFGHGALCIAQSGQCFFSALVGNRSANCGACAAPCRMKYDLIEKENSKNSNEKILDTGYLMSTKDIVSLEILPELVNANIDSLKIEGRMKRPYYTGTTAKIYKKYVKLANKPNYTVDPKDLSELKLAYNRGNGSYGHLKQSSNLVYSKMPNNMGLYLGKIEKYKNNRYVYLKLNEQIELGDRISIEGIEGSYTISEIVKDNQTLKDGKIGTYVSLGRIRGKIKLGSKVFKLSSKKNSDLILKNANSENVKIAFDLSFNIQKDGTSFVRVLPHDSKCNLYSDFVFEKQYFLNVDIAKNRPYTSNDLLEKFSKSSNLPYYFKNYDISIAPNLFLPKISQINEIKREIFEKIQEFGKNKIVRTLDKTNLDEAYDYINNLNSNTKEFIKLDIKNRTGKNKEKQLSLNLAFLNPDIDYKIFKNDISNLYIPFEELFQRKKFEFFKTLINDFNVFVVFPTFMKPNLKNLYLSSFKMISNLPIKGFVLSNLGDFEFVKDTSFELVANYNLNIKNALSQDFFKKLNIKKAILSPELNLDTMEQLKQDNILDLEQIIYGKMVLMNNSYCYLGQTNNCYPNCKALCKNSKQYFLKDKLNNEFEIRPNSLNCQTKVYNSKILSVEPDLLDVSSYRIDILHENEDEIKNIIDTIKSNSKLTGKDYTNGNLYK